MQAIQHLLLMVSSISDKYTAIAKVTGENFNVFKVLKMQSKEVRTHSAILAELLNKNGTHGRGDSLLKIFFNQQKLKQKDNPAFLMRLERFDFETSEVSIEKHIGFLNEDLSEGGRIDILIRDRLSHAVIIENKIFAKDAHKQLVRYNNAYKSAPIFYLTLDGSEPHTQSKGSLTKGDEFVCISYKDDIVYWLEECVREAADLPVLRETLIQYKNLIKYLNNQTTNSTMKKEIAEVMAASKDNINSSYAIPSLIPEMERVLLNKFKSQMRELAEHIGFVCEFDSDFGKLNTDTYLSFYFPSQNNIKISLGFETWRMKFSIGIDAAEIEPEIKSKIILSELSSVIGKSACLGSNYTNWYFLHFFEDPKLAVWNNPEVWCEVLDGSLGKKLFEVIKMMSGELQAIIGGNKIV